MVWKPDRLGRSMRNLVLMVDELRRADPLFKSLTDVYRYIQPDGALHFSYHVSPGGNGEELIVSAPGQVWLQLVRKGVSAAGVRNLPVNNGTRRQTDCERRGQETGGDHLRWLYAHCIKNSPFQNLLSQWAREQARSLLIHSPFLKNISTALLFFDFCQSFPFSFSGFI